MKVLTSRRQEESEILFILKIKAEHLENVYYLARKIVYYRRSHYFYSGLCL